MKRGIILIILTLAILSYSGLAIQISEQNLKTSIEFQASSDKPIVANIQFFPKETETQKILNINILPSAKQQNQNEIIIETNNELQASIQNDLNIISEIKEVKQANYSLQSILELRDYTKTETGSKEIKELTNQLTQNLTDEYEIIYTLANWIKNNIEYKTEEQDSSASETFDKRYGNCFSISNLLAEMAKTKNIPARLIQGITYNNEYNNWSQHAWTEIYFQDAGWVPFDITYNQLGFIDANHIITNYPNTNPESAIQINSNKAIIKEPEINIVTINKKDYKIPIQTEIKPLTDKISPLSFLPIQINITNPNDYYLPLTIYLKKTPNTEEKTKTILLKPNENKVDYIILQIPEVNQALTNLEFEDSLNNNYKIPLEINKDSNTIKKGEAEYITNQNQFNIEILKNLNVTIAPLTITSIKCNNNEATLNLNSNETIKDIFINIEGKITKISELNKNKQIKIPIKTNEKTLLTYILYKDQNNQPFETYQECKIENQSIIKTIYSNLISMFSLFIFSNTQ